jgi:site-specific DNA recombinase
LIEDAQTRIDGLQRRVDAVELDELMIADGPDLIRSWESKGIKEKRNYLRRMIHQIDALPGRGPMEERLRITPVG